MKLSSKLKIGAGAMAVAAIAATSAQAFTDTFNVAVEFVEPFSIGESTPGDFGLLTSGINTTYTLSTANVVASPGGAGVGGTPLAGVYSIADSGGTGTIAITVDNPVDGANAALTTFSCSYGGGAASAQAANCTLTGQTNPGSGGTDLKVGYGITVTGTPASGVTNTLSFDITVVYG